MKNISLALKIMILVAVLFILSSVLPLSAQNKIQFQFRKDHTFKIAQFTDIHWDNNSPNCAKTIETIQHVLTIEKPDIAILTGDIVTIGPAKEGWLVISKIFINNKIPWAITLGNHDTDPKITRDQIFELLEPLPFFVGSKGPELYGCGNYALPIRSSDKKLVSAVIYCLDSNDYPKDKRIGEYDFIRSDQINWYRKTSDQFTASNNQTPIPSLAFFHIPLLEYRNLIDKKTTLGENNESVVAAEINSGFFAAMVEKSDVMGVFVGHNHENNYIGVDHGIALAFGEVTGSNAYGNFERGSRIIELHEGEFKFDSWIRTKSGAKYKCNFSEGLLIMP